MQVPAEGRRTALRTERSPGGAGERIEGREEEDAPPPFKAFHRLRRVHSPSASEGGYDILPWTARYSFTEGSHVGECED
jgi:hypothetical protein